MLGLAGLDGSGRTEVLESICSASVTRKERHHHVCTASSCKNRTSTESIKNGFALLTEERRATGIFGIRDIRENTVISSLNRAIRNAVPS